MARTIFSILDDLSRGLQDLRTALSPIMARLPLAPAASVGAAVRPAVSPAVPVARNPRRPRRVRPSGGASAPPRRS